MTGLWAFETHLPYQKYQEHPIVDFMREVCLLFNFWMIKFTIFFYKTNWAKLWGNEGRKDPNILHQKACSQFFHHTVWLMDGRMEINVNKGANWTFWYFTKIVLTYCEKKIVLVMEKNFWNSRLEAENLQNFWDHLNNLFKQWKVRTIFGNRMLF